jgi:glutathione synthase
LRTSIDENELLPQNTIVELVREAISWAAMNGFQMALADIPDSNSGPVAYVHTPFSLLPNVFPRSEFDRAVRLAPLLNILIDQVGCDQEYIARTLKPVFENDPFTARLVDLMLASPHQPVRLGLHRSDYMLDGPSGGILQVEINTIASSFGCASSMATSLHRFLLERFKDAGNDITSGSLNAFLNSLVDFCERPRTEDGVKDRLFSELNAVATTLQTLPVNPSIDRLSGAIATAHRLYIQRGGAQTSTVGFIVQPGERNVIDQRLLEIALWEGHRIRVCRFTLAQIDSLGVRFIPALLFSCYNLMCFACSEA